MVANVTLIGNLVEQPELRYTQGSGAPYCTFRWVQEDRVKQPDGSYDHRKPELYTRVTVWDPILAENIAESDIPNGTQLVIVGALRRGEDWVKDGQTQRGDIEVTVNKGGKVAVVPFFHTLTAARPGKRAQAAAQPPQQTQPVPAQQSPAQQVPAEDPWGTEPAWNPAQHSPAQPAPAEDPWGTEPAQSSAQPPARPQPSAPAPKQAPLVTDQTSDDPWAVPTVTHPNTDPWGP